MCFTSSGLAHKKKRVSETLDEILWHKKSRQESHWESRRVLPRLLARLWASVNLGESLSKTFGETLGETFRAKESRRKSCQECGIGSYAWLSARLCPRLVFLRWLVRNYFLCSLESGLQMLHSYPTIDKNLFSSPSLASLACLSFPLAFNIQYSDLFTSLFLFSSSV